MSRSGSIAASILSVALLASGTSAAPSDRPTMAVKTFENPVADASSTIGAGLTHIFITELEKTGRYSIIERDALGTLTGEIDLVQTGYIDPATAVTMGHIKGVEYWFMAAVTNFGSAEKTVAGVSLVPMIGGLGVSKKTARVRLDFRVVDATSGETVVADFGEASVKKSTVGGAAFLGVAGGGQWYQSSEFLDSMLGRATVEAIGQMIQKLNARFPHARSSAADALREEARSKPGRVMAVAGGAAFVDMGANAGLVVGDVFHVYQVSDILSSVGEVVYQDERLLGEMTITEVQPDRSRATLPAGLAIVEGNVVRLKDAPLVREAPAAMADPAEAPPKRAGQPRAGSIGR